MIDTAAKYREMKDMIAEEFSHEGEIGQDSDPDYDPAYWLSVILKEKHRLEMREALGVSASDKYTAFIDELIDMTKDQGEQDGWDEIP